MTLAHARVEDGGRPVVINAREAKRLQALAAMLGNKRYGRDAEFVLDLVNRYEGAERLVAVDQSALVGLQAAADVPARLHVTYVLAASREHAGVGAEEFGLPGLVYVVEDTRELGSHIPSVIELPGAWRHPRYEQLVRRCRHLGIHIDSSHARTGGAEAEQPADAPQGEPATGTETPGAETPSGDAAAAAAMKAASEEGQHASQAGAVEGAAPATSNGEVSP
jgi:hypothetical protein